MKMRHSFLVLLLLMGGSCFAQQMKQFSLYQQIPYMFNPASTGWHDEIDFRTGFRKQWLGLDGSPISTYITMSSVVNKGLGPGRNPSLRIGSLNYLSRRGDRKGSKVKHGLGGYILLDKFGVFWMNSVMVNYAFHFPLNREYSLSLGASAGFNNNIFRASDVTLANPNDPNFNAFVAAGRNEYFYDMNFGAWFYSDKLYAGYSIQQLVKSAAYLTRVQTDFKLRHHHYLTAGYIFDLDSDWTITPSMMMKYVRAAPLSWEVSGKFDYKKLVWTGVSYRHLDAIVFMFGVHIKKNVEVSYAYDLPINGLAPSFQGGHELCIGVLFEKKRKR